MASNTTSGYVAKGTALYGTSTTARTFPNSKLTGIKKHDKYLNTENGHVYQCTDPGRSTKKVKSGSPSITKWKYIGTKVIKRPNTAVTGMTLARDAKGSRKMTGKWNVPKTLLNPDNCARAEGLYMTWTLDCYNPSGKDKKAKNKDVVDKEKTYNEKATSDSENLSDLYLGNGKTGNHYTRKDFYPYKGKPYLYSVKLTVTPFNSKGRGSSGTKDKKTGKVTGGAEASAVYSFKVPKAPTVNVVGFNAENGTVTFNVKTDPGEGHEERLWTQCEMIVTDQSAGGKPVTVYSNESMTDTDFDKSWDVENWQQLGSNYVKVEMRARARGFAGDSGWSSKTYYVAFPASVTIVDKNMKATGKTSADKLVVPVKVNKPTGHPVDRIVLEALVNVDYTSASQIPGDAGWEQVGPGDDGDCSALVANVGEISSGVGKRTWLRVKAWHGAEAVCSYSKAVQAPLFIAAPTAEDNKCSLLPPTSGDERGSVNVCAVWDKKNDSDDQDTTGIELSWSDNEKAWRSVKQPETFDFEWRDSSVPSSHSGTWNKAGTVTVPDLEPGKTYWFMARCYYDGDDGKRTYGPYSNAVQHDVVAEPSSAVLVTDPSVSRGSDMAVSWVLSAPSAQTSWQVMSGRNVLASGTGPASSTVIKAAKISQFASGGQIEMFVRCMAGGAAVDSPGVPVIVSDPPTAAVAMEVLTGQPMSFGFETSAASATVLYTVTAVGTDGSAPDGRVDQIAGDTVATGTANPTISTVTWENSIERAELAAAAASAQAALSEAQSELVEMEEGDDGYDEASGKASAAQVRLNAAQAALSAGGSSRLGGTVTLASGLSFHQGASYRLRAVVVDDSTGLSSEPVETTFSVDWSHRAPTPPASGYSPTGDESPQDGKAYYALDDETGDYVEVEQPDSASMSGYYEEVTGITVEPSVAGEGDEVKRACTISLTPPANAAETDVYDVYRITHDGAELAGRGLALDRVVVDEHAPFGDAGDYAYRVACRTVDGDVQWADFDYVLEGDTLRFDFGEESVELPYNLAITDSYKRDVEMRTHDDGTVSAFDNPSVVRKSDLSTDLMRIADAAKAARVRALAQRQGTAYVRTHDGSAYEASVQVRNITVSGKVLGVRIEATRVTPTGAYGLPLPVVEAE